MPHNAYVGFHPSFSRHGITRASSVLLIWLNENVPFVVAENDIFFVLICELAMRCVPSSSFSLFK